MTGPRISVRGDATRLVQPDEAAINAGIELFQPSREQANATLAHAADWVVQQLAALGGAVRTVENHRSPLTWSLSRPAVHERYDTDERGRPRSTGFDASQPLTIRVRDLSLVGRIVNLLKSGPITIWHVGWLVDDDNPAWREVRASAIHAALSKAKDYAAALGATVETIEQIADTGLLASGVSEAAGAPAGSYRLMSAKAADLGGDELSVDPQPQEIAATIEARVVATPVALG